MAVIKVSDKLKAKLDSIRAKHNYKNYDQAISHKGNQVTTKVTEKLPKPTRKVTYEAEKLPKGNQKVTKRLPCEATEREKLSFGENCDPEKLDALRRYYGLKVPKEDS